VKCRHSNYRRGPPVQLGGALGRGAEPRQHPGPEGVGVVAGGSPPPAGPSAARGRSPAGQGAGSPARPGPCKRLSRTAIFGGFLDQAGREGVAVAGEDQDLHLFRRAARSQAVMLVRCWRSLSSSPKQQTQSLYRSSAELRSPRVPFQGCVMLNLPVTKSFPGWATSPCGQLDARATGNQDTTPSWFSIAGHLPGQVFGDGHPAVPRCVTSWEQLLSDRDINLCPTTSHRCCSRTHSTEIKWKRKSSSTGKSSWCRRWWSRTGAWSFPTCWPCPSTTLGRRS